MAWVSGEDVSTGELITAAQWNNYMGASGSMEYLKTEADRIPTISHAEPARAIETKYQYTGDGFLFVTVTVELNMDIDNAVDGYGYAFGEAKVLAKTDSAATPTTIVAQAILFVDEVMGTGTNEGFSITVSLSFFVEPNHYYWVDGSNAYSGDPPTLIDWHEWELH